METFYSLDKTSAKPFPDKSNYYPLQAFYLQHLFQTTDY